MKPEIVVVGMIFAPTQEKLDREFTCHKLYEAADRSAFLKLHAGTARGLATFGPNGADAALMDALPKIEIISNFGVGVDAINAAAARQRRIIVTNTQDVLN
jgi:lactate dehydrogenase-like 2-hydroxyacid dehydrogenase